MIVVSEYSGYDEWVCSDCGQQISPELVQRLKAGEIDNFVCQSCGVEFFKQLKLETPLPLIEDADEIASQPEGSKFEYLVLVCMECDYLLSSELVQRLVDDGTKSFVKVVGLSALLSSLHRKTSHCLHRE